MSGAKTPCSSKYLRWSARHESSVRSPSPSCQAKSASTSLNRRCTRSTVSITARGLPLPSVRTHRLPISVCCPSDAAQHVAVFLPSITRLQSESANGPPSSKENLSKLRQSVQGLSAMAQRNNGVLNFKLTHYRNPRKSGQTYPTISVPKFDYRNSPDTNPIRGDREDQRQAHGWDRVWHRASPTF